MKPIATLSLLLSLLFSSYSAAGEREQIAWEKIESGALVVDVRTPGEFRGGHLEGAVLIPHQQVVEQFARQGVPKDQPVVLYCRSGNRAGIAEQALRSAGYTNLFNGGGFTQLQAHKRQM
ncbi:rhodanese-like domain-containing protein [Motiliproteus sp. SC1-56]|uniref:rhodanese-like domain-containing protein n=1 Tax=Motiliproteus sp. SC1-56 TaxID=2799565 RepID=UPI001A8C346A|nr:rhodanese-like domain-containing protein [Motiliproteus sp. SC1-56]